MEFDPGFTFNMDRFPAAGGNLGHQDAHCLADDVIAGHSHCADGRNQVAGILWILGGKTQQFHIFRDPESVSVEGIKNAGNHSIAFAQDHPGLVLTGAEIFCRRGTAFRGVGSVEDPGFRDLDPELAADEEKRFRSP